MDRIKLQRETVSAILIIAILSLFLIANYFAGFNLPLYLMIMSIAFAISITHPKSALWAIVSLTMIFERFFALIPIVFGRNEYKLYPIDVLMLAMFAGIFLNFLKGEKIKAKKVDIVAFAFVIIAVAYFAASILIVGTDVSVAFSTAKNYAFYGALYFATFLLIKTRDDLHRFAAFVIGTGAVLIGFIAYGLISGTGLWSEYTPLSTGGVRTLAFTHGLYLSVAMIIAAVMIAKSAFTKIAPVLIFVPIWTIGIIGSMMRHIWIALAVALAFVYLLLGGIQKKVIHAQLKSYAASSAILFVMVLYGATLMPYSSLTQGITSATSQVQRRVVSIADSGDESILWRKAVWSQALGSLAESPVFGIGYGQKVSIEIGKYRDFVDVRNMHNSYLVLIVQMGIIGAVVFAAWIFLLAHQLFETKDLHLPERIASIGICVLFLIAMAFQPYLETNILSIFFWINLGIMRRLGEDEMI